MDGGSSGFSDGGGCGRRRSSALPGGEAAAEAEAAGRVPAWPAAAASHWQHSLLGRGAAPRLHEEAEPAARAGTSAPRRGRRGLGREPPPGTGLAPAGRAPPRSFQRPDSGSCPGSEAPRVHRRGFLQPSGYVSV